MLSHNYRINIMYTLFGLRFIACTHMHKYALQIFLFSRFNVFACSPEPRPSDPSIIPTSLIGALTDLFAFRSVAVNLHNFIGKHLSKSYQGAICSTL